MENLRGKAAPAPNSITLSYWNRAPKQGISNQSNHIQSVSTRVQPSIHQGTAQHPVGVNRTLTETEKASLHSSPIAMHTPYLSFPTAIKGPAILHTYRQICIEVVFSVKQGLLVYAAVECQACHHCCFYTPPVENLRKHDTWFCSDTRYVTMCFPHIALYGAYIQFCLPSVTIRSLSLCG